MSAGRSSTHRTDRSRAGTVRTTVLSNRRQTLAVLGYIGAEATTFERLALAGRMLKEVGARDPETLGLMALGQGAPAQAVLDALIAASLAHAFPLPTLRAPSTDERHIKQIILHGYEGGDTRYGAAVAGGTNLARWLTSLPPNILDSRGYHRCGAGRWRATMASASSVVGRGGTASRGCWRISRCVRRANEQRVAGYRLI